MPSGTIRVYQITTAVRGEGDPEVAGPGHRYDLRRVTKKDMDDGDRLANGGDGHCWSVGRPCRRAAGGQRAISVYDLRGRGGGVTMEIVWVMLFCGRRDLDQSPVVQDGRRGLGLSRLLPRIHFEACGDAGR